MYQTRVYSSAAHLTRNNAAEKGFHYSGPEENGFVISNIGFQAYILSFPHHISNNKLMKCSLILKQLNVMFINT